MIFDVKFLPGAEENLAEIVVAGEAEKIVKKARTVLSLNPFPHGKVVRRISALAVDVRRAEDGERSPRGCRPAQKLRFRRAETRVDFRRRFPCRFFPYDAPPRPFGGGWLVLVKSRYVA